MTFDFEQLKWISDVPGLKGPLNLIKNFIIKISCLDRNNELDRD